MGSIEMSNRDSILQSRCLMNQFIGKLHYYLELHNQIRSPCLELGIVTYDRHRIYMKPFIYAREGSIRLLYINYRSLVYPLRYNGFARRRLIASLVVFCEITIRNFASASKK